MTHYDEVYIEGRWQAPVGRQCIAIENPASGETRAMLRLGNGEDIDAAVMAARRAFETYSQVEQAERVLLLDHVLTAYEARAEDLAQAVTREMGAPITLARDAHVTNGANHFRRTRDVLAIYDFDQPLGTTMVTREPIGVCGLITPWNWPLNQIACKVAPALAAGCTMVLKPSELAPGCAFIIAEILDEAGVPPGVFNLVNGDGATAGAMLSQHPEVDMVSFTGSTRAGVLVAQNAAPTVKRVTQELGGKSANIVLDDANFDAAIAHCVRGCMLNAGQSCNAPTRLLVPMARLDEAAAMAASIVDGFVSGDPADMGTTLGPVASAAQFNKVQDLIASGIAEGARLATGGPGRPGPLGRGYHVRPTVFSHVTPQMRVAREEIFGPVLVIIGYGDEDEAVEIANASEYGLSAYVSSRDAARARRVARRLRAGMVHINGARSDNAAPFGGYRQSGNGREWGRYGFEEFLEIKSMFGFGEQA